MITESSSLYPPPQDLRIAGTTATDVAAIDYLVLRWTGHVNPTIVLNPRRVSVDAPMELLWTVAISEIQKPTITCAYRTYYLLEPHTAVLGL
jgi:hypothetical protein